MTAALSLVMRMVCLVLVLASASAVAAPDPQASAPAPTQVAPAPFVAAPQSLSLIDVAELPPACRDLGTLASSPRPAQALSARISLASCLIEHKLKNLMLCDCELSINELETIAQPSFALLDEVYTLGDPTNKILARQTLGDLLQGFATRILATVPAPMDSSPSAISLRETRLSLITPLVNPWFVRAQSAYAEIDRIARANPHLSKNPAVLFAVRSSRAKLAQAPGVAKR